MSPSWQRAAVLGLNVVAPIAFVVLWLAGSFWVGLAILFAAHMLILAGTLLPNSQLLGPVVTHFQTSENEAWLTIDDGPDPVDTPQILDLLEAADAVATFFVIGEKVKAHPELVREIVRRGHRIGNHTETHPAHTFWRLGPRRLRREIIGCAENLKDIQCSTGLFRAPAGMKNPFVHPILSQLSQSLIGWTIRGFDGTDSDPDRILARLAKGLKPGAILLIHEGRECAGDQRLAPEVLTRLLREADERKIRFALPDPGSWIPPSS